jgi:2-hydroxy-3-keto-5-methylthiopentenyl-1-phosphate phosphatase
MLKKKYEEAGHPLKQSDFKGVGQNINLYPGVREWFGLINAYGKERGIEVEHYIISSGMEEIIKDSAIASEMKKIYACRYYYDENGIAQWPAQIVNYTTKTQYIFRINKQVLDESNDSDLNTWVPMEQRPIPFSRMIYIADGLTDVPCMKLVKANGGKAVAVYNTNSAAAGFAAEKLIRENRADFIAPADYTEGEKIDTLVKRMIDEMSAAAALEEYKGVM